MIPPKALFKKIVFIAVAMLSGVMLTGVFLELVLRFLPVTQGMETQPVNDKDRYLHFKPNRDITWSSGWNFKIVNGIHINNYGFVNGQDYNQFDSRPLIAVVGDSYVEAVMVPYKQTIHGRLAEIFRNQARVYSFGASGAPLSQYLAYAELARDIFQPKGLVVVVVGNDFDESLIEFKSAPGQHYLKNENSGFSLELVHYCPSWFGWLARKSSLFMYLMLNLKLDYSFYRIREVFHGGGGYVGNVSRCKDSLTTEKSKKAIEFFITNLTTYAGLPPSRICIVVDGMRPELYDPTALNAASSSFFSIMRSYLIEQATIAGYHIIDMQPRFISDFQTNGIKFEWDFDGHWNSFGHNVAAMAIMDTGFVNKVLDP